MTNNTKAAIYNFVLRAGIGAGIALAYLHISLAPLAQSVVDLDRYLFPVSLAKQYSFLADWRLPEREIELPKPAKTNGCKRDYAAIKALPCHELLAVLRKAGFEGKALRTAYAVARAESSGRPKAFNGNHNTGDQSYGILQINMLNRLGPARRKQFGLKSNEELYDPLTNAKVAYAMSGGGKNWKPWSAYKNGSWQRHLSEFDSLTSL